MACRGFWECILKLLNFLMTLVGLAMVGYGIYLFVEYEKSSSSSSAASPTSDAMIQLGRPMLMDSLSSSFLDDLPKAWYGTPPLRNALALLLYMLIHFLEGASYVFVLRFPLGLD